MKIFDCFMYFDEEVVLDVRLNTLDQFVDYFVIVESIFNLRSKTTSSSKYIKQSKIFIFLFLNLFKIYIYDKKFYGR